MAQLKITKKFETEFKALLVQNESLKQENERLRADMEKRLEEYVEFEKQKMQLMDRDKASDEAILNLQQKLDKKSMQSAK